MFSRPEQKTSSSPSSEKFNNDCEMYKDVLNRMRTATEGIARIDAEQSTSSTSSREKFKYDLVIFKDLIKRLLVVKEELERIKGLENRFVSEFCVFNHHYPFIIKTDTKIEEKSAHEMLKIFLSLLTSSRSSSVRSENYSNSSTQREKNTDNVDDKKPTDEKDLPKDPNNVNNSGTLRLNANNIIWSTADPITRQLLISEPQASTSAAARALNCLNYTIKRKMDNDDQKMMNAGTVSIENNQKQEEHSENTGNREVNVKPYVGLTLTSPSGTTRKILGKKPQPFNTTTERQINNDGQFYRKLKDGADLAIKNDQHLKEKKYVKKAIILKRNNDILDSEPQPSTSKAAMSLKRKISNDVQDWQTDVEDLSIKSNQQLKDDPKITENTVIVPARIDITLLEVACKLLASEPQPSTSASAISLKHETSNDIPDDQKFAVAEDLSIKSNQQLKDDPKIIENTVIMKPIDTDVNAQTCSAKRESLSSESQPSSLVSKVRSSKRTKLKTINESLDGNDITIENKQQKQQQHEYPKIADKSVILGQNGTEIPLQAYDAIIWKTAAGATRQLLGFVFSSDELATHTLTGKPSPAFYGRERPEKMQLNPEKIADVIHCVRTLMNCKEREVRAAITTKCWHISKKYKRRSLKQSKAITSA